MIFLLENWKALVLAALVAAALSFFGLWRHEVKAFDAFKIEVKALGKQAEIEAKRVNDLHDQTVKDVSNAWNTALPKVRDNAVRNYAAAHPDRVRDASCGPVPGHAGGPSSPDGAGKEQMAAGQACQPDDQFIRDAAEDALKIGTWQDWARRNSLPVK